MEIIRQGADPANKAITAKCRKCKTVVKFLPYEAKFVSDQREGDFYCIACPVCKNTITADVYYGYNGPG
jgi:hypothetical protein